MGGLLCYTKNIMYAPPDLCRAGGQDSGPNSGTPCTPARTYTHTLSLSHTQAQAPSPSTHMHTLHMYVHATYIHTIVGDLLPGTAGLQDCMTAWQARQRVKDAPER